MRLIFFLKEEENNLCLVGIKSLLGLMGIELMRGTNGLFLSFLLNTFDYWVGWKEM